MRELPLVKRVVTTWGDFSWLARSARPGALRWWAAAPDASLGRLVGSGPPLEGLCRLFSAKSASRLAGESGAHDTSLVPARISTATQPTIPAIETAQAHFRRGRAGSIDRMRYSAPGSVGDRALQGPGAECAYHRRRHHSRLEDVEGLREIAVDLSQAADWAGEQRQTSAVWVTTDRRNQVSCRVWCRRPPARSAGRLQGLAGRCGRVLPTQRGSCRCDSERACR